jgi:hypothetical protein
VEHIPDIGQLSKIDGGLRLAFDLLLYLGEALSLDTTSPWMTSPNPMLQLMTSFCALPRR